MIAMIVVAFFFLDKVNRFHVPLLPSALFRCFISSNAVVVVVVDKAFWKGLGVGSDGVCLRDGISHQCSTVQVVNV